jgi:hypothetical protein
MGAGGFVHPRHRPRLLPRQAQSQQTRRLAGQGGLVDIGGKDAVWRGADLLQQFKAARTGAGENQDGGPSAGYLNR